jgi:hypothetical protein
MSSQDKVFDPLEHSLRHALRRQVERRQPRTEVRRRLLQRAAAKGGAGQWPSLFSETSPEYSSGVLSSVELGWRELAFIQILRPAGVFGSVSCLLR